MQVGRADYTALRRMLSKFAIVRSNPDVIEDAIQLAMENLVRNQNSYPLRNRQYRAALRAVDELRSPRYAFLCYTAKPERLGIEDCELPVHENIEDNLYFKELAEKALSRLRPIYRQIIQKRFWEGKTFREISSDLNLSPETVRHYGSHSMKILRKAMLPYREEYFS
jgi:RNA polymerase sigma factor (sigma-70 family)